MTITRYWSAHLGNITIEFQAPFFNDLLRDSGNPNGRLPKDLEAHALWHYFLVAANQFERQKKNLVYEGEKNVEFNARGLLEGIAKTHGVLPQGMTRYWDVVEQQRLALGFNENANLPEHLKFRFH